MIDEIENPFSVTKATEFSDVEINDYWVDFNTQGSDSIVSLLNPSEYMPKYVIGGKGCGKTHILRYFSYPLQKIRHNGDIPTLLAEDKYIGLYSVFHGLNSSRFDGKGIGEEQWMAIFEYYFELYICDNLLYTVLELIETLHISKELESAVIIKILKQFNNYESIKDVSTFNDLIEFLKELRRKIDSQILNAAFTRKLDYDEVKLLFSPGDLIFGIPNIISSSLQTFQDIKFIYIFDEYEKLFEWQKKFVNTLVWDKKTPVTFWIGARRYGYTTRLTKSGEKMKQGSEFQVVNLDFIIRNNEDIYNQFAHKLYINRLTKYYKSKGADMKPADIENNFCSRFEAYEDSKLIAQIVEKNKKKEYKHIRELRRKLLEAIKAGSGFEIKEQDPTLAEPLVNNLIESIIDKTNNNPLEQKYKIFHFYQLWYQAKSSSSFKAIIEIINKEYDKFLNGKNSHYKDIKDKRKKDLLAQLTRENNIKNTEYSGIEKFIDLSQGNARTFILILKKIIEYSKIRGEKPLEEGGRISLDTQYLGIYDTSRWFYEDAELVGDSGKHMYNSLKYLAEYFMLYRFCDKPTETTVSSFYIKSEDLSENATLCIETMNMHSIIIEDDSGRFEKNTGRKEKLYKLNKILSPLWNLPSVVRGNIYLNKDIAEAIFDYKKSHTFEKLYKDRKSELNAPDFLKPSNIHGHSNEITFD
jgi:hypothetical protein